MTSIRNWLLAAFVVAGLAAALPANQAEATLGMLPHCVGTDNCGLGGAGMALGDGATNVVINPALATRLGDQFMVSAGWFHADVNGEVHGSCAAGANCSGGQESDASEFPNGSLGMNVTFGDGWAFNFSAYPGGGGETDWARPRTGANGGVTPGQTHQLTTID